MKEKKYWQINTERLAADIREVARKAKTEEDLKMGVEPLLQETRKKMGIDIDIVKYERTATSFRGRSDAVYGYLTIEYKLPGKLSRKREVKVAIDQLQRYLSEQAIELRQQREDFLEKAVGVATDGQYILFLRFTKVPTALQTPVPIEEAQVALFPETKAKRGFQVLGPYPVNKSSISNLLIFFRASARRPLSAEGLASVFAPSSRIAQQTVSELYSMLMRAQRRQVPSRIKAFFQEWDKNFGVVYGQELEKAEKSAAETAGLYQMPAGVRLKQLLFAIHTFYAFLMKLISIELVSLQDGSRVKSFVKGLTPMGDNELKNRLSYLESGADFNDQGIVNFLEADFFSWYLDGWNPRVADVFRGIANALSDFEPATPILEPEWAKDLLQRLYELLVPRKLRHDLGEYYTPDWLAGYVVDKSGYKGKTGSRFLDPACGSGTFLVQAIKRAIKFAKGDEKTLAHHIHENIVGFDLNPIAVLSARTNYLIAFSRFIPYIRPISIPVYLCDSVLTPARYVEEGELTLEDTIVFATTKGNYTFPISMKDKSHIDKFTSMMDVALRGGVKPEGFKNQVATQFDVPKNERSLLCDVYRQIKELDDKGENGFWARYIKNAFAPVYVGRFDFVIGNPPWVRWDYLSDDYRKRTLRLWQKYGLFSLRGYAARLGGGKKDLSMLFTHASADNYLKDNGTLGFLITIEVFKSKGAGEGFRRFELKDKQVPLKVLSMEDMVDLKPFQSRNKTSVVFLKKGKKTTYPVDVVQWKRKPRVGRIPPDWSLDKVVASCGIKKMQAIPVDPNNTYSSWQTADASEMKTHSKLKGPNPYRGQTGAFTTPYGVFWLRVKEVRPDGILVVENMHERGEWEIKPVHTSIEPELVFPAVSGGHMLKFGVKSSFYLLISQDPKKRRGYDEEYLSTKFPLTYAYLVQFKDVLVKRAAYKKYFCKEIKHERGSVGYEPIAPFYSQFDISESTFSRYRVTWKQGASRVSAVVLSSTKTDFGTKPMISTHTTAFFAVDNRSEAHYLCAILNSELVDNFIKSFSAAGRGFGTPSVMKNLAIPRFDDANRTHKRLAGLSEKAHNLVKRDRDIQDIQKEIDSVVKGLWNIK